MPSSPTQGSTSSNIFLNAIQWGGWQWTDGAAAGTNVTYFFSPAGQNLDSTFGAGTGSSIGWLSTESAAYVAALQTWANVANITFTQVATYAEADLVAFVATPPGSLGVHETPQGAASSDGTAWGVFNFLGDGWNAAGLQPGGFGFVTLVHELGHGLGLAHPHDTGGPSGIFPGVTAPFDDYGDYDLNQGIFTIMSYNDGWPTGPSGVSPSFNYGWQSGPMAFDIAAIQALYGSNATYHVGADTYVLPGSNVAGTSWTCIWDAGGTDGITYSGFGNAIINLTAATLDNSPTGGGVPSYVQGVIGGFTIANGVVIENASGGAGNDVITGNAADNVLQGNAGNDRLVGGAGNDTLDGGAGSDIADLSNTSTSFYISIDPSGNAVITATFTGTDTLISIEGIATGSGNDTLLGNAFDNGLEGGFGYDNLYGGAGNDTLRGGSLEDIVVGDSGNDTLYGDDGGDVLSELYDPINSGNDTFYGGNGIDIMYSAAGDDTVNGGSDAGNNYGNLGDGADTYTGSAGTDVVVGGAGNDTITGNTGDDSLYGEGDNDTIYGGAGIDLLSGSFGNDILDAGADNDLLVGDQGADQLFGGGGIDVLYGGADNDILDGGTGGNVDGIYGGTGADSFRVGGAGYGVDYIYDWQGGVGVSDRLLVANGVTISSQAAAASYYSITFSNGSQVIVYGASSILAEDIVLNGF